MPGSLYASLARRFGAVPTSEERRRFLAASLAAGAGLLMSGGALARLPGLGAKRVVVIGGGFAGLACGYELKSAGYDVTVIEARDRVGGRVLSFGTGAGLGGEFVAGRNVEGGGELIGSNHPTWVAYAERLGLEFLDVHESEDEFPIVLGGKKLTAEESATVWEELDAIVNAMNSDASSVDEDEPWKAANAGELDKKTLAGWLTGAECSELCRRSLGAQLAGDNGVANDKASYLGMLAAVKGGGLEKYWTESEVYRCKGGNQQLAVRLATELGKRVITGLGARSVETRANSVIVTCMDGRTIECDDVVLAVPPSVWPRIEFKPALLAGLTPQMGCNVKYLAQVKSRFWKAESKDPASLSDGDITWTWDATDGQDGDENACLTAFSGGPAAERARSRKGKERDDAYTAAYALAYDGFRDNFVGARFMDWPAEQFTGAGYSFPAPGQVTTLGPVLRAGAGGGRLHFAGEHACYKFVGYMEGALNSGASLARRLAARDGLAK